jgi:hypothetical protein
MGREKAKKARHVIECQSCRKDFVSIGSPKRKLCDGCLVNHRKAEMMACVICGKQQKRWETGGKNAGLCCSRKCSGILNARRAKERRLADPDRLKPLVEFCRRIIEKEKERRASALRSLVSLCARLVANESRACLRCCGPLKDPHGRDRFCSDECRLSRHRLLARKRRKPGTRKHQKRAALRGLPRSYSRKMVIQSVGNRDGWICKLCSQPIEDIKSREGPYSPCIDHIVPLNHPANTRHGHTPGNVQIAHRSCNEAKGCRVACMSLIECDNPREWLAVSHIDQTPPGRGLSDDLFGAKTPCALDADF